jgi:hypothetical protein
MTMILFRKIQVVLVIVSCLTFVSCFKDNDGNADATSNQGNSLGEYYLTFKMDGVQYNLTEYNGLMNLNFYPNYGPTGMSFRDPDWGIYDDVYFSLILPLDSTGLSTFNYSNLFVINGSSDWGGYSHPGSLSFDWESENAAFDQLVEHNELDSSVYFNKITSITYAGNRRYDSILNEWRCDFKVQGYFKMRLEHETSSGMKELQDGEYSMLIDVLAQ